MPDFVMMTVVELDFVIMTLNEEDVRFSSTLEDSRLCYNDSCRGRCETLL